MKVRVCIYVNREWAIPYVKSLEHSLIKLGITDHIDIPLPPYSSDSRYISFFIIGRKSVNIDQWEDKCKILIQLEQLINCRVAGAYHVGNAFDLILEPFIANTKLRGAGKRVEYCPIGYSPSWSRHVDKTEKDFDVLFWGQMNSARKKIYNYLKDNGINAVFSNNLYDDRLYEHIARSKIIVWFKHSNCIDYAQLHCLPAQAQKEFVMVESSLDYGLFLPNVDFIIFNNHINCLTKIKYYLKNEQERIEFADKAYEHLKTIPYAESLRGPLCNFLNHITDQKKSL